MNERQFIKWYKTTATQYQKERLKTINKIYKFGLYTAFICSPFSDEV